jgi:hypothetical protein
MLQSVLAFLAVTSSDDVFDLLSVPSMVERWPRVTSRSRAR